MTSAVGRTLVELPWIVFITYWIVAALRTRRTRRQETLASRYSILLIEIAGFVLLFADWASLGWLGDRFLPRTLTGVFVGIALAWLGVGLAIWARYHLAEYWSARITLKEDHQLIRSGPYARLRHPIYTGVVLASHRFRSGDRQMEMCCGSLPDLERLLAESKKGGKPAAPPVRGLV